MIYRRVCSPSKNITTYLNSVRRLLHCTNINRSLHKTWELFRLTFRLAINNFHFHRFIKVQLCVYAMRSLLFPVQCIYIEYLCAIVMHIIIAFKRAREKKKKGKKNFNTLKRSIIWKLSHLIDGLVSMNKKREIDFVRNSLFYFY